MALTRQQLQNDLAAMKKHREIAEFERDRAVGEINTLRQEVIKLAEERDDWRFAFRAICKAVNK